MARRKQLKNIAFGLLNSFISRNNDVNGYWGIGKLYNLMENSNMFKVQIDLVSKSIQPFNDEFSRLIENYSNRLQHHLNSRHLKNEYLKRAMITLIGYPNEPKLDTGLTAPHRIDCIVELTDDLTNVHRAEKIIWCRKHDPNKELKSVREY